MLPAATLDLIKEFEGYLKPLNDGTGRVKPYLCPANVPTIGWGCTRHPTGVRVKMSDAPIDKATATAYLAHELREDEAGVDKLSAGVVWHELMRGAVVSFAYNCGTGAYSGSGLRRAILAKRWNDVPAELKKWRVGGGRVLPGLVRRRNMEALMFMHGVALMKVGATTTEVQTKDVGTAVAPPVSPRQPSVFTRAMQWMFKR